MYKIFNTDVLSKNARFFRGLLAGSIAAIILAIAYGLLSSVLVTEFSLAFIGIGYLIGEAIKKFGRGVKIEFSILGAVLTALCIIFADIIGIYGFKALTNPEIFSIVFIRYVRIIFTTDINSLLSIAFRLAGIYYGYKNSRIV